MRLRVLLSAISACAVLSPATAMAQSGDTLVTIGSPPTPFSQNKQNEPAVTYDPSNPQVARGGRERQHRPGGLQRGRPEDVPVHGWRRRLGHLLLVQRRPELDSQPTYNGLTARDCLGPARVRAACRVRSAPCPSTSRTGWSPTAIPRWRSGRAAAPTDASRGPTARVCTTRTSPPTWPRTATSRRSRASRRSPSRTPTTSGRPRRRTTRRRGCDPVIVSRQSSATFSDKEQVCADNAASSPFFGNVYVCYVAFRANGTGRSRCSSPARRDGARRWRQHQVTPATNNGQPAAGRAARCARTPAASSTCSTRARTSRRAQGVFFQRSLVQRRRHLRPAADRHVRSTRVGLLDPAHGRLRLRRRGRCPHLDVPERRHRQRRADRRGRDR